MEAAKNILTLEMYYKAIEGSDSGLWVYDVQQDICYLSNRYYTMLGYAPGEFPGTLENLFSLLHPDDAERTNEIFKNFFDGNSDIYRNEVRLKTKSGDYKPILTQGLGERDENGKLLKFIGWNIDISSLRDAQKKLDEERALNIAQSRLAQLGLLAGGLAHEINNPLTVVQVRAQMLMKSIETGKAMDPVILAEKLGQIQMAAKKIADIVSGLKIMASGGMDEVREEVSLSRALDEVLTLSQNEFTRKKINLTVDRPQDAPIVQANFALLCQVFLNLLNNASDALEDNQDKQIYILVTSDETNGIILVEDNGPGIRPEDEEKIMLPFFTTKGPTKGTGLGLTISKSIVDSMGGKLTYERSNNRTRFKVSLPLQIR